MFRKLRLVAALPGLMLAGILFLAESAAAKVDHALLQDGKGLFNVLVEDTHTTQARPWRIRFKPESFQYDYDTNSVAPLLGHSAYFLVSDFAETTNTLGKFGARRFMESKHWHRFIPPPPIVIVPFTPAPPPTPTPVVAAMTIDPSRVAETTLPLERRVEKQLRIFIDEQSRLSNQIRFSVAVHVLEEKVGRESRLRLLQDQLAILTRLYPLTEPIVQRAKEALEHQIELVKESGKFSFED